MKSFLSKIATCGVKVHKVIWAVLRGVGGRRRVVPAQPSVPVAAAVRSYGGTELNVENRKSVGGGGAPLPAPTCLVVRWLAVHFLKAFVLAVQDLLPDHFLLLRVHHGTDRGLVRRVHLQVRRELRGCLH